MFSQQQIEQIAAVVATALQAAAPQASGTKPPAQDTAPEPGNVASSAGLAALAGLYVLVACKTLDWCPNPLRVGGPNPGGGVLHLAL